ncbi:hypothetical protein [Legionella sp. PC997]|uniref:hypothetical protein n=1 Tax=Legionella sp. PC997 TaxID=2755562 RepID=UPI0015FD8883|nr:hypothetical protein [Legionella sp. PC997]QMT59080.1 hypothetical protein HBNCFIEN_00441 [Legionella sp. PC997]
MHNGEEVITKDFQSILLRNGFSTQEFKITIKNGSSYDPNQIVSTQVWITIEKDFIQKKYGLYRTNWPYDFESDLNNGYFNP